MKTAPRLGVNVDHVATLREARQSRYPDPVATLMILRKCRVEQVTIHLREDRRHIQDHDFERMIAADVLPVNLELALSQSLITKACRIKPERCTFVPEKRQEVTTEGGLDCRKHFSSLKKAIVQLKKSGVIVSLFIDPDKQQVLAAQELGADAIELHTGAYCHLYESFFLKTGSYKLKKDNPLSKKIFKKLDDLAFAATLADQLGLDVAAGHGLHAGNLPPVLKIAEIVEYNIGHAIIARAVFVGFEKAVREIQSVIKNQKMVSEYLP